MAKIIDIENTKSSNFFSDFQKAIQSANLNFLMGSGCSVPAIPALAKLENEIQKLSKEDKTDESEKLLHDFICQLIKHYDTINSDDVDFVTVLKNYTQFVGVVLQILFERKSSILHKQATIFTTNYDMFFELAFQKYAESIILFDGFRRIPSINQKTEFSTTDFFNTIFNTGNLYKYRVEIPSCNLIKVHGSLNWFMKDNKITESLEHIKEAKEIQYSENNNIAKFNNLFSIILPRKEKFKETLLNQTYYDLLRIFSNELDKENTLLVVSGFSFADEHLFEIVKRALRNPTLKIIIFCWGKEDEAKIFTEKFDQFNNVEIVFSSKDNVDLVKFSDILKEVLPLNIRKDQDESVTTDKE